MLLNFRMPDCIVHESYITPSGFFKVYLGSHYHNGILCWLVGWSDKRNGNNAQRHYNDRNNIAPKANCWTYYEEMKEKMHELGKTTDENDEISEQLKYHFDKNVN